MSGQWPPGWEDPADEEVDAEELGEETGLRFSEVAAFLATAPAPVLPGAIESRIVAALAAESAARAGDSSASAGDSPVRVDDSPLRGLERDRPRVLGPAQTRPRVRRSPRLRSSMVAGPLVACLLFAGLGYAISRSSMSSSSSSVPAGAAAASSPASSAAGRANGFSSSAGSSAARSAALGPPLVVTQSGTEYQAATLTGQVRSVLASGYDLSSPTKASVPSAAASGSATSVPAASASASGTVPTSALRGCVLKLIGKTAPRLVDRASYQGTPVYVIATASRVWVVGLDCTAARPDVITHASLAS